MEYEILQDLFAERLSNKVNDYLKKGWKLYGKPFYADDKYNQAVIYINGID